MIGTKSLAYALCLTLILTLAICLAIGASRPAAQEDDIQADAMAVGPEEVVVFESPTLCAPATIPVPPIKVAAAVELRTEPLDALYGRERARAEYRYYRDNPPPREAWEPDSKDLNALAKTLWGECRGCSELQKKAVCWCVFNRVDDSRFPNTVYGVVSQPSQFFGFKESFPVDDGLYELAYECMVDWHNGENRVLEPEFLYFTGNGRINVFTTEWGGGEAWDKE